MSDIQIEGLHVAFNLLPHSRMERNCCRMDGVAFCTYECESAKATLCSNSEQHVHSRALRKMHQYTPSPGVGIKARERERERSVYPNVLLQYLNLLRLDMT